MLAQPTITAILLRFTGALKLQCRKPCKQRCQESMKLSQAQVKYCSVKYLGQLFICATTKSNLKVFLKVRRWGFSRISLFIITEAPFTQDTPEVYFLSYYRNWQKRCNRLPALVIKPQNSSLKLCHNGAHVLFFSSKLQVLLENRTQKREIQVFSCRIYKFKVEGKIASS